MDKKPKVCFDCINCEQCPTGLAFSEPRTNNVYIPF